VTYINPSAKLFQHLDRLAAIRAGERAAPVNVEIDLSNRCSHGCSFCHFAYTHTRGPLAGKVDKPQDSISGGDLMDKKLAYSILDQLHDADVRSVTWTGGGEPTLHPDFDKIIDYADDCELEQGMYTHGGHINAERAAMLKRHMTWIYVSLDECDRAAFKQTKGVDRFPAVMEGVRNLVHADGNATIGLGFLLHEQNYTSVNDMVRLGRALGVDYVQFRPVVHFEQDKPGTLVEDTEWITQAIRYLRTYERDPFVIADVGRFQMYRGWTGHGYKTCNWSALQTVITPNGKVWRCTNKREHPDALLGDLSVEPFATLWARNGGPCEVNAGCRVLCRGHIANVTLDAIMQPAPHGNFI
jgi:MoaA/NifB/PqqE/SkfB family radical SAM enzyme